MVESVELMPSTDQSVESGEVLVESEMVTPSGDLIAAVTRSQSKQASDDND